MAKEKVSFLGIVNLFSERDIDRYINVDETVIDNKPLQLNVYFSLNNPKTRTKLLDLIKSLKYKNYSVSVNIDASEMNFKVKDMEDFIDLEEKLDKIDASLCFSSFGSNKYSLNQVLNAQTKLDDFVEYLKSMDSSPYEKFLMIYEYVSSMAYKEDNKNRANSRDLIALMNGNKIVCVGYAKLMEYFCEAVGIKCQIQNLDVYKDGKYVGGHQNNIVCIKDEKYGIDGWYYADACWDSVRKKDNFKRSLNYCLLPFSDIDFFKPRQVDVQSPHKCLYERNMKGKIDLLANGTKAVYYNFFGEPTEIMDNKSSQRIDSVELRASACDYLTEILKGLGIPDDFYRKYHDIPKYCESRFLLAMLMAENFDEEMFKTVIDEICEINNNPKYLADGTKYHYGDTDVYEYLESIKTSDHADWQVVKNIYANLLRTDRIYGEVRLGEPIDIATFESGLINMYKLQGIDERSAKSNVKQIIDNTEEKSERLFFEGASNCFRQSILGKRKNQNNINKI